MKHHKGFYPQDVGYTKKQFRTAGKLLADATGMTYDPEKGTYTPKPTGRKNKRHSHPKQVRKTLHDLRG